MQASWGPSSTSRCLRNVLSWELPRSFPHHPQPIVPSYACSSSAFAPPPSSFYPSSFISPSCPLSLWYLATVQCPLSPLKGSLKAGVLPRLQTPLTEHVGWGKMGARDDWEGQVLSKQ